MDMFIQILMDQPEGNRFLVPYLRFADVKIKISNFSLCNHMSIKHITTYRLQTNAIFRRLYQQS